MSRTILGIVGIVLAIWLVIMVIGAFISMLKTFLFWGIIAAVGMAVVMLIAKSGKSSKSR